MARVLSVVAVLALVVTAGCLTGEPTAVGPTSTVESAPDAPFTVPDRIADRESSPWGSGPITVVVDDHTGVVSDVRPAVEEALAFWEHAVYPGDHYRPAFELAAGNASADVRVEVVPAVERCRVHEDDVALGCAPVVPANATVTGEVTVQVRAGHAPATTRAVLKHELGHVLGFRHGEGPGDVMAPNLSARVDSDVADAAARTYSWGSETLQAAVVSETTATAAARERVRAALGYYERGADGTVASPPAFELVDDPGDADVVVALRESVDCEAVGVDSSCAHWDGPDVDDDGVPEYYTDVRIAVAPDGHDRAGWHAGYWLGKSLWTNGVPSPFRSSEHPPADSW
ncbi:peptidase M10 family protein [Halobacterium hubeiense]|uniref:Peptidase M10 family protein n=1 Tax=Halobacterium hubeiense TaxID=1407499 RepID=A0A0U5HR37_9EURY|nr:hypothetical protein [Halobacterium hubeiense]CQH46819.1 peptidase M10 family protein [Halobacterium hubeiense]